MSARNIENILVSHINQENSRHQIVRKHSRRKSETNIQRHSDHVGL